MKKEQSLYNIRSLYSVDNNMYYNKEYREGFPREFLSTADVDSHRSRRLRWLSTAEVDKNP